MNEFRPMPPRTEAATRRGRWPGWIWSVPVAALLVVGWLALRAVTQTGTAITITFHDSHGISAGNTDIVYRGMKVGKVTGVTLAKDGVTVKVHARVDDFASRFLTKGTLFWLRGAKPNLGNLSTLGAILSGPTIVMHPGAMHPGVMHPAVTHAEEGKPTTDFAGLARKPAVLGDHGAPQSYGVSFQGAVGALSPGDAVTLRGFTVGEVKDIGFRYDAGSGALSTPVTLSLYPKLFHIEGSAGPNGGAALKTALGTLVREGLRAQLSRDPPLIGAYRVTLAMVPGAPGAELTASDGVPEIPAASGGGIGSVIARIDQVPVKRIAQNVLDATRRADALVASPKLEDSIAQLDAALRQVHDTAKTAGPKIARIVQSLRKTAGELDQAASAADKVAGGAPSQNSMGKALREITEAARSIRALADFLDRHPEALIQGRS